MKLARIGALVAGLAIATVCLRSIDAAPPTDAEYKALLAQDVKSQTKAADAGMAPKAKGPVQLNAATQLKSSAVLVAAYSNAQIDGKDAAKDAQAAGIRDEAIKLYQAAEKKDFKLTSELAKGLATAKPAAKGEKIDVVKALGAITSKDVMENFTTTTKFGSNVEADIRGNGRKAVAKPMDTALIVHRVMAMGELSKTVIKAEKAEDKAKWAEYNEKMIKAAEELLAVSTDKKANPAALAKAFTKLDGSCNACHDDFKN